MLEAIPNLVSVRPNQFLHALDTLTLLKYNIRGKKNHHGYFFAIITVNLVIFFDLKDGFQGIIHM